MRAIRDYDRAFWKRWTGYHARSRVKAKLRCLKAFGKRIAARDPDCQTAELHIRSALMNRFSALGTAEIKPWHDLRGIREVTLQAGLLQQCRLSACLGHRIGDEGGEPQMDDLPQPPAPSLCPRRQATGAGVPAEQ
ncbi:hypothetical protein GCM10011415_38920 [Salipiger pallidus]|uniref:Uncharacterized protein n=1 Tax=Salipiger pallidus TaxID=1775170 RepID=A0A8J2ZN33_9RHOB|nr:hypothetical protein GCM10011415_38920 [Salipiger pallidus]